MILIALTIYVLFNLAPKWILKEKYKYLEENFSWKIPLMKLTGLVFSIVLAFLLTLGLTKSVNDKFIENKNAIYGLEFNSSMEKLGFQDSMKIKTINGQEINKVSDIIKKILLENDEVEVCVEKNGIQSKIKLNKADKISIIHNSQPAPIVPIMHNSKGENKVKVTTLNYGLSDVLDRFGMLWKQTMILINPNPLYHELGGFVTISNINKVRSYVVILALNLIVLAVLNLLPLPGFSIGNFAVSVMETLRKKQYEKQRKRLIGWISIFLVVVIITIRIM